MWLAVEVIITIIIILDRGTTATTTTTVTVTTPDILVAGLLPLSAGESLLGLYITSTSV